MSKHPNHEADIKNANKGTDGQNKTHAKAQWHRGWQKILKIQLIKKRIRKIINPKND